MGLLVPPWLGTGLLAFAPVNEREVSLSLGGADGLWLVCAYAPNRSSEYSGLVLGFLSRGAKRCSSWGRHVEVG